MSENNFMPSRFGDAASIDNLQVQIEEMRGLFGIGKRVIVPTDEIHVVVADGWSKFLLSKESKEGAKPTARPQTTMQCTGETR